MRNQLRNQRVLAAWRRGESAEAIAELEGVSVPRVREIALGEAGRRSGAVLDRRTIPKRDVEREAAMRRMRAEGKTFREIGEAFGVSQQMASKVIARKPLDRGKVGRNEAIAQEAT